MIIHRRPTYASGMHRDPCLCRSIPLNTRPSYVCGLLVLRKLSRIFEDKRRFYATQLHLARLSWHLQEAGRFSALKARRLKTTGQQDKRPLSQAGPDCKIAKTQVTQPGALLVFSKSFLLHIYAAIRLPLPPPPPFPRASKPFLVNSVVHCSRARVLSF